MLIEKSRGWRGEHMHFSKANKLLASFKNASDNAPAKNAQRLKNHKLFASFIAILILMAVSGLSALLAGIRGGTKASTSPDLNSHIVSSLNVTTSLMGGASQDSSGPNVQNPDVNVNAGNGPASVTVGGQTLTAPSDGSLNKTVNTSSGNVNVSIQSNGSPSTSKTGHSFQNVSVYSHDSSSNTSIQISQQSSGGAH